MLSASLKQLANRLTDECIVAHLWILHDAIKTGGYAMSPKELSVEVRKKDVGPELIPAFKDLQIELQLLSLSTCLCLHIGFHLVLVILRRLLQ